MSFASREKKRRYKQAERAQRSSKRIGHQGGDPSRWWITIVKRDGICAGCGGTLRAGSEMVFRYKPRELLCVPCSQLQGIAPSPSLAWDRRERKRRRRGQIRSSSVRPGVSG
jgi:hypothetical protein